MGDMGDTRANADAFSRLTADQLDRRRFLRRVGVGGAVAGGAWVAPAIFGTSVAFAAGSGNGGPPETLPPDPDPPIDYCGKITWPATNNNPTNPASAITYPLNSDNVNVKLNSVTGALVGATPPSLINPQVAAGQSGAYGYRNLMGNARPFQGQGTISGNAVAGLVLVQNNAGGGNTSFAAIVNYQEVTFTFNTVISNLRFQINDLSATTIDGTNTTVDTIGPFVDNPLSANDYAWLGNGAYRDSVSFNRAITVSGGNTTNLTGTGTFSNPLRRTTAADYFIGLNPVYAPYNVPMDVQITMPGPLSSFKMRYATVGGRGTQWIQLRDFFFGNC